MNTKKHPVWGVYDLYRTARLNVKYYSAKLYRTEKWVFWMDLILAITAPSSVAAGLWLWGVPVGQVIWKLLGVIAAFVAVTKPLLGLNKKVKAYEELQSGYRVLEHDLRSIKEMIHINQRYDKQLQDDFKKALARKGILESKDPETKVDDKLRKKYTEEVKRELPPEAFYIPPLENKNEISI